MKYHFCTIIIFCLCISNTLAGTNEGCDLPVIKAPIDSKKIGEINKLLSATKKEKKIALQKLTFDNAKTFLNSLPEDQQKKLNNLLSTINKSKTPLVQIVEAEGDPILLVQGLDNVEFPPEWIKPFHQLLEKNKLSYYFKWNKVKSIEENRDQLVFAIKSILEKNKDKNLTIIGYSAGGIVATFAMDTLTDDPISKRIYFHTVASPFFGYNAPDFAVLGIPFVGKTPIEIGRGSYKKLVHKKFTQCTNWVNTNCELDDHTCADKGLNPELGLVDSATNLLPCGNENTIRYNDENHSTILNRAFSEIVK